MERLKQNVFTQCIFINVFMLITLSGIVTAKNSYVITVPKTFRPGMDVNMNVFILKSTKPGTPVDVNATFFLDSVPISSAVGTFQEGITGSLKLQIPFTARAPESNVEQSLLVTGTGGLTFNTSTDYLIEFENKGFSIYIQTDKGIYKPGQPVKMRILGVYPDLKVYIGKMTITIADPKGNTLAYWKDEMTPTGVVTKEFELTSQPNMGDWKIIVQIEGNKKETTFEVKEYVLPKFKVEVVPPKYASAGNADINVAITAIYTYGKSVKGTGKVNVYSSQYCTESCPSYSKTFEIDGTYTLALTKKIIIDTFRKDDPFNYDWYKIYINVSVTDELTKKTQSDVVSVPLFKSGIVMKYSETNTKYFKPGFPFKAMVEVTNRDGTPATNTKVVIEITTYKKTDKYAKTHVVDDDGYIIINYQIPSTVENLYITGKATDKYGYETNFNQNVGKFHSKSDTFLTVTAKDYEVAAGDEIQCDLTATEDFQKFSYMVLSRGNVIRHATEMNSPKSKTASLKFSSSSLMSPTTRVVVYFVRGDAEIVADSVTIKVNGAFENQVSVKFSSAQQRPGDDVNIEIKASAGSEVGLLAVDKSVLLMGKDNDLSYKQVVEELESYGGGSVWFPPWWRWRRKRSFFLPWRPSARDSADIFRLAGLVVLSDNRDMSYYPYDLDEDMVMESAMPDMNIKRKGGGDQLADVEKIRSEFPETWLWQNVPIGATGETAVQAKVPDTITSWVLSGFSVSNVSGFGVANEKPQLTVFQPFFVSLDLPYSVIRGEQVAIKVIVFNYEETGMEVTVTLERSNSYQNVIEIDNELDIVSLTGDTVHIIRVPSNSGATVSFPIIPTKLGAMPITVKAQSTTSADAVKRVLLVKPEGVEQDYSYSLLLDFASLAPGFQKYLPLLLPSNVVEGSAKGTVSLIGDIMGSSINGIERLLRIPYGCGEQNMINFAPSMFIRAYLQAVGQLTPSIRDKTVRIMTKGYQRELIYQHHDGSYSAFGERYGHKGPGSLWLTSFVVKSFSKASSYIYIDNAKLQTSIDFILRSQQNDGSYKESGHVSSYLQGGLKSSNPEALSAYILISLLESGNKGATKSIDKVLLYLKDRLSSTTDTYTLTLLAYAFELANDTAFDTVMIELLKRVIEDDGTMHWEKNPPAKKEAQPWLRPYYHAKPADIEMTAYVLLAYAHRRVKEKALPIARWLAQQKNSLGGYSSTQDTVVGLHALSEFAPLVYTTDPSFTVNIGLSSNPNYAKTMTVDKNNLIVLQEEELPTVAGDLTVSGSGKGMGVVQVGVTYNIAKVLDDNSFTLNVLATSADNDNLQTKSCVKYAGDEANSGMAIMEVGFPTGFGMDQDEVDKLLNDETNKIQRIETPDRKAVLYFDEIPKGQEICVTLNTVRQYAVGKSQPVPVKVYAFYEPGKGATVMYTSQDSVDVCDVCQDCTNCKPRERSTEKQPTDKADRAVLQILTIGIAFAFAALMYYLY